MKDNSYPILLKKEERNHRVIADEYMYINFIVLLTKEKKTAMQTITNKYMFTCTFNNSEWYRLPIPFFSAFVVLTTSSRIQRYRP